VRRAESTKSTQTIVNTTRPREPENAHAQGCVHEHATRGLSEALKEEVIFDKSKVTSTNWDRYKILTMEEMPEIKVVPPAAAAAFFDATGVQARGIPLTPVYVTTLLQA
jgi:nicotinate dehydrogenase subunit B